MILRCRLLLPLQLLLHRWVTGLQHRCLLLLLLRPIRRCRLRPPSCCCWSTLCTCRRMRCAACHAADGRFISQKLAQKVILHIAANCRSCWWLLPCSSWWRLLLLLLLALLWQVRQLFCFLPCLAALLTESVCIQHLVAGQQLQAGSQAPKVNRQALSVGGVGWGG